MGFFDLILRRTDAVPPLPATPPPPPMQLAQRPMTSDCAHAVADQVRLLFPEGPRTVTIQARCDDTLAYVDRLDAPLDGLHAVPPRSLADDRTLRIAHLAARVGALWWSLGGSAGSWSSFTVTVERATVRVGDVEVPIDEDRLRYGTAFMALVRELDRDVDTRQAALAAFLREATSMQWRRDERTLDLGHTSCGAHILGSYDPALRSWLWAWANDAFSTASRVAVASVRDSAWGRPGMSLFRTPEHACTEPFAFCIAYSAAQLLGGRPVWRLSLASGVQLFFAIEALER